MTGSTHPCLSGFFIPRLPIDASLTGPISYIRLAAALKAMARRTPFP